MTEPVSPDDNDMQPFEINDFTTASDWERSIKALEQTLLRWASTPADGPPFPEKPEQITFNGDVFDVQLIDESEHEDWYHVNQATPLRNRTVPVGSNIDKTFRQLLSASSDSLDADADDDHHSVATLDTTLSPSALNLLNQRDFIPGMHPLRRWYGVNRFVLLESASSARRLTLDDATLLLGALCVAANSTSSQFPVFVRMHDASRQLYLGRACDSRTNIVFETTALPQAPQALSHLSGMLGMFRDHIRSQRANGSMSYSEFAPELKITVAARFSFHLSSWFDDDWNESRVLRGSTLEALTVLPYGPKNDPCEALHLAAIWPSFPEDAVLDNAVYSELDPTLAPMWTLRAHFLPIVAVHNRLNVALQRFADACRCTDSLKRLLETTNRSSESSSSSGPAAGETKASDALWKITDNNGGNLTRYLDRHVEKMKHIVREGVDKVTSIVDDALPSKEQIDHILAFIFDEIIPSDHDTAVQASLPRLKAAPLGSLTANLAVALCRINHKRGGVRGIAMIWSKVVKELRYHWENLCDIPAISGLPDLNCSLVHQKLQMLNACIRRQREWQLMRDPQAAAENHTVINTPPPTVHAKDDSGSAAAAATTTADGWDVELSDEEALNSDTEPSDNDEEDAQFFDAAEEVEPTPDGVAGEHTTLRLLHHPDEPLRIPIVQEAQPMTEDQIHEQMDVYSQMGTSEEAVKARSRMQAASLLSDMEAFKAANPKASLEDFVRWHSPRDWQEERMPDENQSVSKTTQHLDQRLSSRMREPGNLWLEAWQRARLVPVAKQKSLFDATREAEKVLHFFENLEPGLLAASLAPCVALHSVCILSQSEFAQYPSARHALKVLTDSLQFFGCASLIDERMTLADVLQSTISQNVAEAEYTISRLKSMVHKLGKSDSLVDLLLTGREVAVLQESDRVTIANLFRNDTDLELLTPRTNRRQTSRTLSEPDAREFILRSVANRPTLAARACPQRLYVYLGEDEFRLAGAFSHDPMFR